VGRIKDLLDQQPTEQPQRPEENPVQDIFDALCDVQGRPVEECRPEMERLVSYYGETLVDRCIEVYQEFILASIHVIDREQAKGATS
jgi:hypothetical protein